MHAVLRPDARRVCLPELSRLGHGRAIRRIQASGNGREYADWGIHDFLEIKGIVGWGA